MLKKLLILSIAFLGSFNTVFSAPYYRVDSTIVPKDSTENIGTSTNRWNEGWFNSLNVSTGITFPGLGTHMLTATDASGNLVSTSSPVVGFINATSTTATSTFSGFIDVTGTNSTSTFSGNLKVNGNLEVDGVSLFEIVSSGNTTISGTLSVTQGANFATASGLVGIGVTAPDYKLDVRGSGNDGTSAGIQIRSLAALGNTSAAAFLNVRAIDSSGFLASYPSDYTTTVLADRTVLGANSDATGVTLYAPGASQDIRFFTGNTTEKMRIDNAGNVGIGVTAPNVKLTVAAQELPALGTAGGSLSFMRSDNAVGLFMGWDGDDFGWIQGQRTDIVAASPLALQPNGGNVGIGTTTPSGLLHISNGTSATDMSVYLTNYGAGNKVNQLKFVNDAGQSGQFGIQSSAGSLYGNNAMYIDFPSSGFLSFTKNSNTAEYMRITNAGNVGIGTTTPSTKFEVHGSDPALRITSSANTPQLDFWQYGGIAANRNWGIRANNGVNGDLQFNVSASNTGAPSTNVLALLSSGNVGIGITAPTSLFHASRSYTEPPGGIASSTVGVFSRNNTANGTSSIAILARSSATAGINFGSEDAERRGFIDYGFDVTKPNLMGFSFGITGSTMVRINGTGNLGIGTTSPISTLSVVGNTASTTIYLGSSTRKTCVTWYSVPSGNPFKEYVSDAGVKVIEAGQCSGN